MRTRKTQDPNFARVVGSQLIINTNDDSFNAYIGERQKSIMLQQTVNEVNSLKNELSEFKAMLATLLNQQK